MSKRKYHSDFVSYLRQYPAQWEYTAQQELSRLQKTYGSSPDFRAQVDQQYPDPHARMAAMTQKAAQNANQISQALLEKQKKRFDVKSIDPATLHEAFTEDRADWEPDEHIKQLAAANGSADPAADYRQNVVPGEVASDMARVSPYLFPKQKTMELPPEQITAAPKSPPPRARVEQAPAPVNVDEGSSFDGGAEGVAGDPAGGAPVAGGSRMYQPGTEAS